MSMHCHSCTAPLDSPQFKGASDIYCKWCVDEQGNLQPREQAAEGIAHWFMQWQGDITPDVARQRAEQFMRGLPAWADDADKDHPAPLPSALVRDMVGNAHGDFDRVKQLLEQEPKLVNACWDWGGGDWETALGAAAHCGRKDIALYLLERGARIDVFAAAMLGKLELVRAILTDDPGARHRPGPHGIPLLVHAQQGGEDAAAVVHYLQSLDAA